MARDPDRAPLEPRQRALVDYSLLLARTPGRMTEEALLPLRRAGLTDRDIHDACAVAAYYCFVNRLASGLGVALEPPAETASAASSSKRASSS